MSRSAFVIDLEKCLEGLVKLFITSYRLGDISGGFGETTVITSYRLGEMSGGSGETSYDQLQT